VFGGERYVLEGSRIHPLVFIPGILGTMPPDFDAGSMEPILRTYEPLLTNLQLRGFELNKTLFPFPVDWRDSIEVAAARLSDSLPGFLQTANLSIYVGEPATGGRAAKADLVVHSMGGLTHAPTSRGRLPPGRRQGRLHRHAPPRFSEAYRTREGLTWDSFLADGAYEVVLGKVLDKVLWPVFIGKRYRPSDAEMETAGCLNSDFVSCPRSALYDWSHDPVKGVFSLLEMLPDESAHPYLVCADPKGVDCTPSTAYPFGRETNPCSTAPAA
jgi:hypothetical protein